MELQNEACENISPKLTYDWVERESAVSYAFLATYFVSGWCIYFSGGKMQHASFFMPPHGDLFSAQGGSFAVFTQYIEGLFLLTDVGGTFMCTVVNSPTKAWWFEPKISDVPKPHRTTKISLSTHWECHTYSSRDIILNVFMQSFTFNGIWI